MNHPEHARTGTRAVGGSSQAATSLRRGQPAPPTELVIVDLIKYSLRFPKSGGWGYALFNYEAASDKFTADPSPSDCGHACHVAVKAKDHIFHPYQNR